MVSATRILTFSFCIATVGLGQETVKALRERAERGDAQAEVRLALAFEDGREVARDYAEAVRWLRKAAEQGNADARIRLGDLYFEGLGVRGSNAEAAHWYGCQPSAAEDLAACALLRRRAEEGDAHAQFSLGRVYELPQRFPFRFPMKRSDAEAARWYRKAAEQGDAEAQTELARLYEYGSGVPRNDAEAVRWYRKAAEQGITAARFRLADLYFSGTGVEQDFAEAARWHGCPKPAEEVMASCREITDDVPEGATALLKKMGCGAGDGSAVDLNGDDSPEYRVCCHEWPHGPCDTVLIGKIDGVWKDLTPGSPSGPGFSDVCAGFFVLEGQHAGFHDVCVPDVCASIGSRAGRPCTPMILQFDGTAYREPSAPDGQSR